MANVELGRDRDRDTLNVSGVVRCPANCPLRNQHERFRCEKYNGDSIILVTGGIRKNETLEEFKSIAPCMDQ